MKKLPIIFQGEAVECGLAVLTMVLQYHGYQIKLSELRLNNPVNLSGMSLTTLLMIAQKNHLTCRVLRMEPDQLNNIQLPAILHWNLNHYVVLEKKRFNKYIVFDPGKGILKLREREFSKCFTGIAIECFPSNGFIHKKSKSSFLLIDILLKIPGIKSLWVKIALFTILYQQCLLVAPKYLRDAIDHITLNASPDINCLIVAALGFLFLRFLIFSAQILKSFCLVKLDIDLSFSLSVGILQQIMKLPLTYFEKRLLGDIFNRFNSTEQIRQVISNGLIEGGLGLFLAFMTYIFMLPLNTNLTFITSISVIILIFFRYKIVKIQQINTAEMLTAKSNEQTCFIENIRGIQPIKIFAKESDRISLWMNYYVRFLKSAYKTNLLKYFSDNLKELLLGAELIFLIYFGCIQLINKYLSIGEFYLFLFYRQQFLDSLLSFVDKINDFKYLSIYKERLEDILLQPNLKIGLQQSQSPQTYSVQAVDLSFSYSEFEPPIFNNLSLKISNGECVAITGPSGFGKSTLLKVLMGLIEPQQGYVAIDNIPLNKITHPNQFMASVMQNDCLLTGTIAQNISFFSPDINNESVIECSKKAGIYEEILKMPMKFDTMVGDMGTILSGGQMQRILLARALYSNPKILFLDEATSHLDVDKEQEVNKAIKSLGITCIMIAHRKETIDMADRIIDIRNSNAQKPENLSMNNS